MAEDMDLTWTAYHPGKKVRFIADAICYPIEPHNFHFMRKQLMRWTHGFIQNARLHWKVHTAGSVPALHCHGYELGCHYCVYRVSYGALGTDHAD